MYPTETSWPQDMIEAAITNQTVKENLIDSPTIAIPIMVSEQVIGVIRLRKDEGAVNWTDDEIEFAETITERLSQALEGSRLFYETQKQAAREQMTSSISAQFRQSLDIEAVMKTAVKELSEAFNAKEVMIRMTPDDSTN